MNPEDRANRAAPQDGPAQTPCGLWRRLLSMTYDAVAVVALLMFATAVAMLAGFREVTAMRDPGFTLYLAGVSLLYFALSWHRGGKTLGMRAWRVRVATRDGALPGWGRCVVRFAAALLSAGALGLGFLWSLFDVRKRTWHDRISGTFLYRD